RTRRDRVETSRSEQHMVRRQSNATRATREPDRARRGQEHYAYPRSHESGTVEKRLTFAYGRTLVTSRIIVFVSLAILAAILIDVTDRDGFLAAFEERRRLLPPVQSNRARADLGD